MGLPPAARGFAMVYHALFDNLLAPLFYFFFAVFPTRSPVERRVPWLKWFSLVVALFLSPPGVLAGHPGGRHVILLSFLYGLIVLGFVSLIGNAFTAPTPEERRKIRVILWGTLVGVVPAMSVLCLNDLFHVRVPPWVFAVMVVLLWLFPLSFAYAVAKHRVLEIPVLLKRSARYLLVQRGFVILLSLLSVGVTLAFALSFARYLVPMTRSSHPRRHRLGDGFRHPLAVDRNAGTSERGGKDRSSVFPPCLRRAHDLGGPDRKDPHRYRQKGSGSPTRTPLETGAPTELHSRFTLRPPTISSPPASGNVPPEIQIISVRRHLADDPRPDLARRFRVPPPGRFPRRT